MTHNSHAVNVFAPQASALIEAFDARRAINHPVSGAQVYVREFQRVRADPTLVVFYFSDTKPAPRQAISRSL